MLETDIQRAIIADYARKGWSAIKIDPGSGVPVGFPDLLCIRSLGRVRFIEVKRPGESPTRVQLLMHKTLRVLGFEVLVASSVEEAWKTR